MYRPHRGDVAEKIKETGRRIENAKARGDGNRENWEVGLPI